MTQGRKHIFPPKEVELPRTLHGDRHRLEEVEVPIVTISATYRGEIAKYLGERSKIQDEAVFSRAHFSMGLAVFAAAKKLGLTSWYVDPTNYVSGEAWKKIAFIETVGKITARIPILKKIKDFSDTFARRRLPVGPAVEKPLNYVTERVNKPIISLHYESGNILARDGKRVIQVVTDPHVRPQYLEEAGRENITFAVFDGRTKIDFLVKAKELGKKIEEEKVIVTGPPVDPRIVDTRKGKKPNAYKTRGLRLAITTGGLGTNKGEIQTLLENLLPKVEEMNVYLVLYASTQKDFKEMFVSIAKKNGATLGGIESNERVRVVWKDSIFSANRELIENVFPWADGFVTKPSGDMAYDAAACGCFILSLEPWGEWENNIEKIFEKKGILQKADIRDFPNQIRKLNKANWFENAIRNALNIDKLYLEGAKRIVDLQQKLSYNG